MTQLAARPAPQVRQAPQGRQAQITSGSAAEHARAAYAPVDMALLFTVIGVVALGLVMVTSASVSIAGRELGDPWYYAQRQALYLLAAIVAACGVARVPMTLWRRYSPMLLLGSTVLLVLVLVPGIGREVNGSSRWLDLGITNLQPSELVKIAAALYLAGYLVRQAGTVRESTIGFLKPMGLLGGIAILLLLEPDYGATVVLFTMALGMLFLGGVPIVSFGAWLLVVVALMATLILAAPPVWEWVPVDPGPDCHWPW
jgi:cell division protein FtsW